MNFLIVNGAVIAPQYGDENDRLAIQQLQQMFPDRQIVGVQTGRSPSAAATSTASPSSSPRRNAAQAA